MPMLDEPQWHEIPLTDDQVRLVVNCVSSCIPLLGIRDMFIAIETIGLFHAHLEDPRLEDDLQQAKDDLYRIFGKSWEAEDGNNPTE